MNLNEDLKPCPFCGSNNLRDFKQFGYFFVLCTECQANGPNISPNESRIPEEKAREAWNERK